LILSKISPAFLEDDPAEILAVDEMLVKLEQADQRAAEIVKLRYFAGLTVDETAQALGLGPRTVDTHMLNLRHKLEPDPANPRYVVTVAGGRYLISSH